MTDAHAHHTPPPSDAPLMSLRDVSFAYTPTKHAVQNLSVDVHRGRVHMLIGPNGSGKSTLIQLMLGYLKPRTGRILFRGTPLRQLKSRQRAEAISYVPQRSSSSFAFSVRQVIEMGQYTRAINAEAVNASMDECELTELADQPYVNLSVGQQQRVLLARALVQASGSRAALMLLDEPTGAMDPRYAIDAMRIIQQRARSGLAMVCVVQDINLAVRFADVVWILRQGALFARGPADQTLDEQTLSGAYDVQFKEIHDERDTFFVTA